MRGQYGSCEQRFGSSSEYAAQIKLTACRAFDATRQALNDRARELFFLAKLLLKTSYLVSVSI